MSEPLGPLQLEVMKCVWHNGPSTVHDVHGYINLHHANAKTPLLAYTTILTVLRSLVKRKFLKQDGGSKGKELRRHMFTPIVTRPEYTATAVRELCVGLFNGDDDLLQRFIAESRDYPTAVAPVV